MKKTLRLIIFLLIGLGFIWWFISKLSAEEIKQLFESFSNANYFWFFVALLVNVFSAVIRAIRWQQLISPMGYKPKLMPTFLAVMSGYLTNLAVPRLGEIVRCGLLSKNQKIPFEKTVGTVIIERTVDALCFALFFFIALMIEFNYIKDYVYNSFSNIINFSSLKTIALYGFIAFLILCSILLLFRKRIIGMRFYRKIVKILSGFMEGIKSIFKLKNPLLFIFNSLFIWFLWILGTYVIFLCFGQTSHLAFKIAFVATVLGAIGPIVTPGGIGIFPAIIAETLLMYAIVRPVGYAAGWLLWIVSQIGMIILGLVGFIYFSKGKKENERVRQDT
ncbi:MAG: lysylphosphatidylglycerol synthase transmembrane domain-containing protein [Bacteroidales bacterium]|jgi:uncharacterized protein (TIRG00374 family)|nr:lysylphosphatidylglycerol synthase transmembrane domain-containing protein [Bacteroidales bacterium]MDD4703580.1 lysylphosphatidylglycerol synthase transmembrane domain-containing protein [Bacteroidales bacterium]MDX9799496.1 lysylphosphatidylglycerol synthase transmembrane domain-containing protein [Bacteroidales bacterium]